MKLSINGADVDVDDRHARTPLLWVLRDVLGMHGTKYGCGIGYCSACTVLIDGRNTRSCQITAERAVGKSVVTVEGASGPVVDAVRDAWYHGNVVQCGYCQPGQTLAAISLLESNPAPDAAQIAMWMHRVPRSQKGSDALHNRQLLHGHCHDQKTAEDMALAGSGGRASKL